jgi:hypothetical protein
MRISPKLRDTQAGRVTIWVRSALQFYSALHKCWIFRELACPGAFLAGVSAMLMTVIVPRCVVRGNRKKGLFADVK